MRATRRELLRGTGLAVGGALVGSGVTLASRPSSTAIQASGEPRPWSELQIIGEPVMDDQLLWYLGHVGQGLADVGEVLDTAAGITAGDDTTWFEAWLRTASRVEGMAEQSLAGGHAISAGEIYLRASNYYRAAVIRYAVPDDPRMLEVCRSAVECFDRAIDLLAMPARAVAIPYENTTLPGYFFRSPAADGRAPLVIVHQGFHAWPEETMWVANAALRRGYHCLFFHGPGQGLTLRRQGLPFRSDWENVVSPVVDFALEQPGVDADRLVLMGCSFGGLLAPRAVAFEKRIKICVANPGVLNWAEAMNGHFGDYPQLIELVDSSPAAFDLAVKGVIAGWPAAEWWFVDAVWKHGASSPSDLMLKLREFNNEEIVEQIDCHMLVMDGTGENVSPGQARKLYDALRCEKDFMLFTPEDTGLVHCQAGALAVASQRLFDWLDDHV